MLTLPRGHCLASVHTLIYDEHRLNYCILEPFKHYQTLNFNYILTLILCLLGQRY